MNFNDLLRQQTTDLTVLLQDTFTTVITETETSVQQIMIFTWKQTAADTYSVFQLA